MEHHAMRMSKEELMKKDLAPARKRVKLIAKDKFQDGSIEAELLLQIRDESIAHSNRVLDLVQQHATRVDLGRLIAAMDAIRAASRDACDAVILPLIADQPK